MSILIEKISHNTGEGIITGSYPPGEVYNVTLKTGGNNKIIKWNDPEDTIINGTTLSTWYHTILVRKQGSIPESPDDGDLIINNYERNKYSQTEYQDTGLTSGATYYYRFFTFNTEEICNNSGNMIFCEDVISVSTTLSDNDWETIIEVANAGSGQDYWNVGDEITLQISGGGIYTMTCTMQIWDFNHFDKSDGSGKANICLGCKDIYLENQMHFASGTTGWINMDIRKIDMQKIYNGIPSAIKDAIKEVTIQYNSGYTSNIYTCNDKVFIPSLYEVGVSKYNPKLGTPLPIFSDDASRIKNDMRPNGGDGDSDFWWTRTLNNNSYGGYSIHAYGYADSADIFNSYGIVFCFNI